MYLHINIIIIIVQSRVYRVHGGGGPPFRLPGRRRARYERDIFVDRRRTVQKYYCTIVFWRFRDATRDTNNTRVIILSREPSIGCLYIYIRAEILSKFDLIFFYRM